jgi:hypothetical protein
MTFVGDIVAVSDLLCIVHGINKEDKSFNLWSLYGGKHLCCVSASQMKIVHVVRSLVEPNYKFDDIVVFRDGDFTGIARFEGERGKTEVDVQETYKGGYRTLQRTDIMYMAPAHVREVFVRRWNDTVAIAISTKEKELELLDADFL